MATTDKKQTLVDGNPWKGLNFYKEGEILYGRDEEIQSLALYVTNNTQTVLYGKSGIGKSSIVNAGVFPIARQEGLFPVPIRLKHDNEIAYIEQIKIAFNESGIGINEILGAIGEKESLWEYLHRNNFFDPQSHSVVRPLIVFDQFEEIFTLQHNENKKVEFFSELADLINEVTPEYIINTSSDNNTDGEAGQKNKAFVLNLDANEFDSSSKYLSESLFNIVFTIREDFLSYLERYTRYIPKMKSNRYALLPLNEEQAMDIIMKPLPGLVDIGVAKLIIQKVTGKTDFSLGDAPEIDVDAAVLSLYLSRLFIKKGDECEIITSELVNQFSKDIIKDFYIESVSDLPDSEIEKIEDQLITSDGLRNNVSLNDLINEGVAKETIKTLVEERKLLRQFSYQDNLRVEFMHDILCAVVNERIDHRELLAKEKAAQKAKEEDDARREKERFIQEEKLKKAEEEKQILLRKQQLQEEENRLLQRKQEEELIRAEREKQVQQEQLERAEKERKLLLRQQELQEEEKQMLLRKQEEERIQQEREKKELEEKANAEKEALEAKARRIKNRNRRYFLVAAGIILLVIGYIVNDKRRYDWVFSEYFTQFETINGWPVGVGDKLEKEDLLKTSLYYKLSYTGAKNKRVAKDGRIIYTDVEVMSSNGSLPNSCRIPMMEWSENEASDDKAKALNDIIRQVVSIHYSSNENSADLSREEWFDKDRKKLMAVNYFRQPNGGAWAQFYTPNGENMKIRGNGKDIDRLKLSWDSVGHIESVMYYDNKGVAREIENGNSICGYYWERQGNDTIIRYALNQFGLPTSVIPNNTVMTVYHGDKTETIYLQSSKIRDGHKHESACKRGYTRMISYGNPTDSICYYESNQTIASAVRTIKRDDFGNVIQISTKGRNLFGFPPISKYEYQKGLVTKEEWLSENGTPYCQDSTLLYKWEYSYDENGLRTEEKKTDIYNKLAYHYRIRKDIKNNDTIITTSEMDLIHDPIYVTQVDTINGGWASTTFYGENLNTRINKYIMVGNDSLRVHRVLTKKEGNTITKEFYGFDSLSVVPLQTRYDDAHIYVKSYFKRVEEYDNAGNLISLQLKEPDGTILKSMMYFVQNGQIIGRAVKGIEGKPVRCDKWEEDAFLYYKLYYNKDFMNQFCGVTAVDEWEHRSTTYDGEDYIYFKPFNFRDKWVDVFACDDNGRKMEGKRLAGTRVFEDFEQFLYTDDPELSAFAIPYIHVLSPNSSMYDKENPDISVFDGDRIIEFNNWKLGDSKDLLEQEWNKSFANKASIRLVVLRPNIDSHSFTKKVLSFNNINDERKLIEFHFLLLSNEEKRIIQNWIK